MSEEKKNRNDLDEILARTGKQVSISTTGPARSVLILALNTFEDANSAGEAFRRALANWGYNQKQDSKRGALARLEEGNAKLQADVYQLLSNDGQLLALVRQLLEKNESLQREIEDLQNQLSSQSE